MPQLGFDALIKRFRPLPNSVAIFLYGEEEYLREEAVRTLLDLFLEPATRDFNLDQLRGGDVSPEGLASLLATPPMMADRRVVILREAQSLSPKGREVLEAAAMKPMPGVILLITATIPSGSKAKFYGTLKKHCLSVDFPAVDALDLPGWLIDRASAEYGVVMEVDAARALSAEIGSDLGILGAELEKIAAYIGDRKSITVDDIKAVGGYVPRVDRWAWFDLVGERRFGEALADLPALLDSGENAVGLVIGIGSHLLKIGLLVGGGREGLDRNVPPRQRWLANRLQNQARRWTLEEVDRALAELLRADRLLKSASFSDRQAMEELLLRLSLGAPDSRSGSDSPGLVHAHV